MAIHHDGRDGSMDLPRPTDRADRADLPERGWHPVVFDRLVATGGAEADDLRAALGVPEGALVRTLEDLVASGLVEREVTDDDPLRVVYEPSDEHTRPGGATGDGTATARTPTVDGGDPDRAADTVSRCDDCGEELLYARDCSYCGRQYCASHRLPENHGCPGVDRAATLGRRFDCGPDAGPDDR